MISDAHLHSEYSTDGEFPLREMMERAISLGMDSLCITDHMDMDFPKDAFWLDTPSYVDEVLRLREEYRGKISLRLGVELGLQTHIVDIMRNYLKRYPFDFVIGSQHLVQGQDPYYRENFPDLSDEALYRLYFQELLKNVQSFSEFDVLGHLDYVVRYGYTKAKDYSYARYADEIDAILKLLIEKGCGLELNTGGIKYGLGFPNPHGDILKRYRQLGGEIITVGSDAHDPKYVGYWFLEAKELLKACGFTFYAEFSNRKPVFQKL